ncbi:hypothetical protein AAY78_01330 [Microbacterium sp. Ag1]|nr:hypothetical protein AAY78_01330 [Microbacterium sp. Ag1]
MHLGARRVAHHQRRPLRVELLRDHRRPARERGEHPDRPGQRPQRPQRPPRRRRRAHTDHRRDPQHRRASRIQQVAHGFRRHRRTLHPGQPRRQRAPVPDDHRIHVRVQERRQRDHRRAGQQRRGRVSGRGIPQPELTPCAIGDVPAGSLKHVGDAHAALSGSNCRRDPARTSTTASFRGRA